MQPLIESINDITVVTLAGDRLDDTIFGLHPGDPPMLGVSC
jgi:hypothetical protein